MKRKHAPRPGLLLLLFTLWCSAVILHAGVPEQAASANASLVSGHPNEALSQYIGILGTRAFSTAGSPELWYNRGLAERAGGDDLAASVSFRRALLLNPALAPARSALSASLTKLGVPVPLSWKDRLAGRLSPEFLVLAGSLAGWIGLLALIWFLFSAPRRAKRIAAALLLVLAGHGAALLGTWIDPRRTARDQAVVTEKGSPPLRSTPADNGTALGTLVPGGVVTVISRNGAWWYVSAGPGHSGWISAAAVTPLLPAGL